MDGLGPPGGVELGVGRFDFGAVDGEFALADQERAGVGDGFVEVGALLFEGAGSAPLSAILLEYFV